MEAIIVDDESFSADYLEEVCVGIPGLDIAAKFQNAPAAMEYLEGHDVGLVFLDIEMPGLSGIEAAEELRSRKPGTAVIFVTGYEEYAFQAFQADAVAYLLKPCSEDEVARAVEKAKRLAPPPVKRMEINTFGHFGVFVGGEPLRFANGKARELFAVMVDRKGDVVTMEQAVSLLWEDRPYGETVKQLYRKAIIYLRQMEKDTGIHFFVSERGSCHLLPAAVECDYFRLLAGDAEARKRYAGEYMLDFSWAETTAGYLERLK